jgi:putative oxidoreductase
MQSRRMAETRRLADPRARPELGVFLFRLFLGTTLIWGVVDNVLSWERMLEFRDFLAQNGFPVPWYCAQLSVYAQLVCGGLLVVGALTRAAAAVMVFNFLVALGMVHVGLPFNANIAPLAMLFGSILFLFHGGGAWSVDARRR